MSDFQYVTKETLEQMKQELQRMKGVDRPAASRAIAEAREKGDLKENAEYDAAKEAQGLLEAKIAAMEGAMSNIRVLDEANIDTSKVSILTKVTLTNLNTQKKVTYKIVSETEADLKAGKISVTSPIGKGILGKHVGDTAEVQAPADARPRILLIRDTAGFVIGIHPAVVDALHREVESSVAWQHEIGGDDGQRAGGRVDLLVRQRRIRRVQEVEALVLEGGLRECGRD